MQIPAKLKILFFTLLAISSLSEQVVAIGVDIESNSISISIDSEPPSLDTSLTEDVASSFILGMIHDRLVRVDARGKVVPGIAETWSTSKTGARFQLRKNARWSDGTPITAHDFVYAWRRLVDPETGASGSTFFAYVLKNATSILKGEMDKLSLGVVALDDNTLEVTTSRSIPYLLQVLSGVSYAPLREDFVVQQGSRYAAEAETMLFSGPFVLDSWVHGASLSLRKNPQYWNAQKVKLNRIEVPYMTTDKRALLNLYNSHEIATLALNADILLEATNHGYRIRKKPNNCASIITLNHRAERATSNKHLRKALQYAFDASMYVNKIIALPGTIPTLGVYPSYVKADGKPFADQYPSQISTPDLKKARAFLDLAKSELKELPPLVLLSRENAQRQDEYLQAAFKETLGIEVKIDRQSFKQAIARLINGDFDLAFSGFCAGTMDDPFMSVVNYTTPHPYNDGRFSNKEYDDLFELTSSTDDPERRMKAFARMQDILLEEAAIIPTHESSSIYIQVNNVRRLEYGPAPNFSWASIRQ